MATGKKKVRYKLSQSPDYRTVAANSVWGGLTPRGDIKVDFCVESQTVPTSIENEINEDGRLGKELKRSPQQKTLTRELQVGVVMDLNVALSIAEWLRATVEKAQLAAADIKGHPS